MPCAFAMSGFRRSTTIDCTSRCSPGGSGLVEVGWPFGKQYLRASNTCVHKRVTQDGRHDDFGVFGWLVGHWMGVASMPSGSNRQRKSVIEGQGAMT